MRPNGDKVYHVELHPDEQDFAEAMKSQAGLTSDSDLLRLGLWHLAKHLDVPIGTAIFALGRQQRMPRRKSKCA